MAHICTNADMVPISVAAKAAGVQYQYVFGAMRRGDATSARTGKPGKVTHDKSSTGKHRVCLKCVLDIWGSVVEDTAEELRAEPIQAYRSWDIHFPKDAAEPKLGSGYQFGFMWTPGGVEARCTRSHSVPHKKCTCGLYAAKDPLSHRIPKTTGYGNSVGTVLGACELWGRYVEGDDGWRAQYGRPVALLCNNARIADAVHLVASIHDIPVTHRIEDLGKEVWDGHWKDTKDRGSNATAFRAALAGAGASCRAAAAGASTLEELKMLYREGLISESNVWELIKDE